MTASQADRREPWMVRRSGLVAWTLWAACQAVIVLVAVDRAPKATVGDWIESGAVTVLAILVPALLIYRDHAARCAGRNPGWWRYQGFAVAACVWFGLAGVYWSQRAGVELHGWAAQLGGVLFFAMLPALGMVPVWTHYESARRSAM